MKSKWHIVPYGNKWAIRKDGYTKVTSIHGTKESAINVAKRGKSSRSGNIVIHNKNGKAEIEDRASLENSYIKEKKYYF